tara:strand:+ start:180 stop:1229 length:1050 start_codon:yes stop_codon:yes gene_type:complete
MIKKIVIVLCLSCIVFSCGSKKAVAKKNHNQNTKKEHVVIGEPSNENIDNSESNSIEPVKITSTEQYLALYSGIAQDEMRLYGIPASITLAQGILESNSGKGRLSVEANNHFGIKCHDWTGDRIYHDDDASQECFRKYNDAKYSYRDHSLFLTNRKRYSKLFELDKDDYKQWAKELKAAGYATDRKYPDKLIKLIERYNLDRLDEEVLGSKSETNTMLAEQRNNIINESQDINDSTESVIKSSPEIQITSPSATYSYKVEKGDTLYSISKKFNVSVDELKNINNLADTAISLGQELRIKTDIDTNTYTVEQGDTLYSISKKYNTTVKALQQLNKLNGTAVSIGQELVVK